MKKILTVWFASLTLVLASCGLNKNNPEEIIKQTQINIINKIQQNVFAQKNVEFNSTLSAKASTPLGSGNWNFVFTGKTSEYTGLVNLAWKINFDVQWQSGSAQISATIITTLKKIYFSLHNLEINIPDPTVQAYASMAKMLENKWFYTQNTQGQVNEAVKNVDFKEIFKKYALFKVKKVIKDRNYQVELNKENLAKIIIEANKQIDPNFTGKYEDIEKQLKDFNVEWNLKIQPDNLHFEFSGNIENYEDKTPIQLTYLENKFKLVLPTVEFNFDVNQENFNGYIFISQANVQIPAKWKIAPTEFNISLNYNQQPIEASLNFDYKIKKLEKVIIPIPENAIDFQKIMETFWAQTPNIEQK